MKELPPNALPEVTIVICARNAASHLKRSIPAALGQDYPVERFSVLVVDNGSKDGTAQVAREMGAHVVSCLKPGVVNARQKGWLAAKTEVVAYLDADCEPPADWLSQLAPRFVDDANLASIGGKLVPGSITTLAERHIVEAKILDSERTWSRHALGWPFLPTAALLLRRKALIDLGGFDLNVGKCGCEDADLAYRLREAGWNLEYEPSVEVKHHHRATVRGMMRQTHWYGKSAATLFAKWRVRLGWWRYTDWAPYRRLLFGLLRTPVTIIVMRGHYEKVAPLFEALDAVAFLTGKWKHAWKERVLFL